MQLTRLLKAVILLCVYVSNSTHAQEHKDFIRTSTGVEISIKKSLYGIKTIRLEPVNNNIIHVTASSVSEIIPPTSLMSIKTNNPNLAYELKAEGENVVLSTSAIRIDVDIETGAISFKDKNGQLLLKQNENAYQALVPKLYNGAPSYKLTQIFDAQENEAYYGFGQHQQGIVNYRDRRVDLVQYNTEVAVPFFVSNKNYGILWDNYSITRAGDIRDYEPLNALKLFAKTGEEGWLTSSYSLKNASEEVLFTQPVSEISYNWLTDQHKFPGQVKMNDAVVKYEGAIGSDVDGLYQLQLKYAGYVKVWFEDQLVASYWRQAWNPGSAVVDLNIRKNKRSNFKIEWIPDGTESYLGVTCLPPPTEATKNTFALHSESGTAIDYYFIQGKDADEIISGYREVTGKAVLPPKWAMGFWQSRERYKTQDEILNTVKEFRSRKIPLDNIVLDWSYWKENQWGSQEFDLTRFPDADQMIKKLHDQNVKLMISVWPKFYKEANTYNAFNDAGFLFKRNIADGRRDWIAKGYQNTFYDPFNSNARTAFWELMSKKLYHKGIDAWWMDATEPDMHSNLSVEQRKELMTPTAIGSATTYFNAFPLQNAKTVYDGQRAESPEKRVFILTRSAYAGSQRYAATTWSGDIASRWEDMKSQIGAGINFSLSGMPYWTMDIGGFSVERRYERAKGDDLDEWRELNTRWFQFGAFVPMFRVHGQFPFREVYNIAPADHPAYKSMLYYNQLRYRLLPYIYSLAGKTYHEDYTIMRGLVMDFQNDLKVSSINDAYMFGPSLLINPVYDYKARSRKVYLPAGQGWYDFYTGKYFKGGQEINAEATYERMPVYVKEGSIIPVGPELQYTDEHKPNEITLYVYGGANATFSLYEDEGTNYNYEKGSFSTIKISYDASTGFLNLADRQGSYEGMLSNRVFNIVYIDSMNTRTFNLNETKLNQKIKYDGKKINLKIRKLKATL